MWSLFMIDTHLAGGYGDFTLVPQNVTHIKLPCHDQAFALGVEEHPPILHDVPQTSSLESCSPLAHVVVLRALRHKLLAFTKSAVDLSLGPQLESKIQAYQRSLDKFLADLPPSLHFSEDASRLHSYVPTFMQYATIHVMWHGTHLILYRLVLTDLKEALCSETVSTLSPHAAHGYWQRCSDHAQALARVLASLLAARREFAILDLDLAVSAYQCSRVLFCLYRANHPEMSKATVQQHSSTCRTFVQSMLPQSEAVRTIVSHEAPKHVGFSSFTSAHAQRANAVQP